jgi:superfamily I DNA/RNA helicase
MNLPKPIGRQKEVLYLPAKGHFAVLGTAGSGKTTLAILRSAFLSDPKTEHSGKTLLVTFNKALVSYLKHIQDNQLANVVVENYHTFARGYLAYRKKMSGNVICPPKTREDLIAKAVEKVSQENPDTSILRRSLAVFYEELSWIVQHGISDVETYKETERIGRANTRIERKDRELVFKVCETYKQLRQQKGKKYDWDDIAMAVSSELDADRSPRRYKHIIIDEGQDFSPEMIRSLTLAIPPDGSLTFFGDVAQQIYGQRMTWRSAGLNIEKVWEFQENYRNSREIARLALAISRMPYFKGVPDIIEPISPSAEGPLPTVVLCSSIQEEINFVVSQAAQLAKRQSVAILLRTAKDEERIKSLLPRGSIYLHRDMKWQTGPGIRYGTYHSAKGLEFDAVILPFCNAGTLPEPEVVKNFGEREANSQDGRLLYVGVTRAKTRLIITYTGEFTSLLPTNDNLYERVNGG